MLRRTLNLYSPRVSLFGASPKLNFPRRIAAKYSDMKPGSDLTKASCEGFCDKETPLVTKEDLAWLLPSVPRWKLSDDGKSISRKFVAKNFMAAIDYFNRVAEMAEKEGHHPDLHLTDYRDVLVTVSSHSAGGLTLFDFVLAAKLDTLKVDYSTKFLREHGPA